ncbi:family 43 glycosylhydrolase [Bifidobacterium indicum]|uniref:family 43 glycosylhydrolase n=1 Tax=Bifidobacterium indicum TaxID=1691 RepID=UPI0030DB6162
MLRGFSAGVRRWTHLCALGAAVLGLAVSGSCAGPALAADATVGGIPRERSAAIPQPALHYDFASVPAGSRVVPNAETGSSLGEARILDARGGETGAVKSDGALLFDGSSYVKLPDDVLRGRSSATVSVQVRNDAFNGSGPWTYLWSLGGTGQSARGSWATSTHTSLYTSITSKANGDGETFFSASRNLNTERFETLTATVDGTDNTVRLYINGRAVGSAKAGANPADFGDHSHNVIGQSRYPGVGDALFHGAIKSFSVYDTALSQTQIEASLPADGIVDLLQSQAAALSVPEAVIEDFTLPDSTESARVHWSSSNPAVLNVDEGTDGAHITRGDQDVTVTLTARLEPRPGLQVPGSTVSRSFQVTVRARSATEADSHERVSVHDPGVVKANGKYYLFGSHRAWARSTDLKHWEPFTNNLSTDYQRILAPVWNSWPKQPSNPDVTGNMWAPDVIWNPTMHKWCMYLSLNGGGFPYQKSTMVLLTADDIEGDWTLVGPVIYSGFNAADVDRTDVPRVLGADADLHRYDSLQDTGINMIDACVRDDGQGGLWMSFGSWFGGIWMIRLDPATGLRDYGTTYTTKPNTSDAYYGHKLAGGFGNSGEGSALVHRGGWWYLILSYGGLSQTGGYQMREFRSRSITGPYVDQNGKPAVYGRHLTDDTIINRGLRIDSSYIQPGQRDVYTSQGGNSVLVDGDCVFNVFHTRFVRTEGNLEEHQVRVQQMVTTADGWLVMAPFEYTDAVGTVPADQVPGTYQVVVHDPVKAYAGSGMNSDAIYRSRTLQLLPNGSLSGVAAGSWNLQGSNLTLQVSSSHDGALIHGTYHLSLGKQLDESGRPVVFFTGLGGDLFTDAGDDVSQAAGSAALWGSRPLSNAGGVSTTETGQKEVTATSDAGSVSAGIGLGTERDVTVVADPGAGDGHLSATGVDATVLLTSGLVALGLGICLMGGPVISRKMSGPH